MNQSSKNVRYYQWRSGKWDRAESSTVMERPVSLSVNGEVWLTWMCTPDDLDALAVGFLFNEGIIQAKEDIESVRICPNGDNVDVWLDKSVERPKEWRKTSGCTGGVTSADLSDDLPSLRSHSLTLHPAQISRLIDMLIDSQDLYKKTGGVHTSALSDGVQIIVSADDIGRHNTLDKIAGRCLLEGTQLSNLVLITTGRISSEMLQKAARIGAAVVISRTSPSSLSIEMAERWGITLIGYARRERFNVYSCPERLAAGDHPDTEQVFIEEKTAAES